MKTFIRRSLTFIALGLIATAWSVAAELPSECRNIEPSLYPPPGNLMDYCRQFVEPQEGISVNFPSDMADGVDGVLLNCASMTLSAPEIVSSVGSIPFRPACDFANNDFTKLYCYDSVFPGSTLSSVDPSTCVETPIGTASNVSSFFSGMAWDATTGTMFATTVTDLYTIDLATGASTLVGPITNSSNIPAIGIDPNGDLFGFDVISDSLVAIDKTTGADTIIGPLGFDAGFAEGMDFDHTDGTCYLFAFNVTTFQAELRTCNTCTGATTLIGAIGSTTPGVQNDWTAAGIRTPDGIGTTLIFEDGFESGDIACWSSTAP